MLEKKHLKGVNQKKQRQYEHILENAKNEGRQKPRSAAGLPRTAQTLASPSCS